MTAVETVAETLAIGLLGFFTVGCVVVAGAECGLGMLLPLLARGPRERRQALTACTPALGSAWLAAAVAVLLSCLPRLAGELLRAHWPALVALLLGAVVRRAGLRQANQWVMCGSWLAALGWSWLLAALLTGGTSGRSDAGATVVAPVVALLFALHGLGFGTLRLTGRPFERARLLAGRSSSRQSFVLTAVAMAALPLASGMQLPLRDAAMGGGGPDDGPSVWPTWPVWPTWLPWSALPLLMAAAALLAAAQIRAWRTFPRTFWDTPRGTGGTAP